MVGWGWGEGYLPTCKGFYKNSHCSSSQLLAKDSPAELSSLPPGLGMCMRWRGGLSKTIYIVITGVGREGLEVADSYVLLFSPLSGRMVCTYRKGECCREADGYPQFPVSVQMAAPTPISVLCSGYGEPPHGTQAWEPIAYCPSFPGYLCKDFYPGQLKGRWQMRDPGRQGLNVMERTPWGFP